MLSRRDRTEGKIEKSYMQTEKGKRTKWNDRRRKRKKKFAKNKKKKRDGLN